jgi:small nuclear ribonucleoprotein E
LILFIDLHVLDPQGFDEYMNLVLDEAEEVSTKRGTRTPLGRILLKGDNITMMLNTSK